MVDDLVRVKGCPLCEIFLNPKENIKTKLYYPDSIDDVPTSEFVIIDCNPSGGQIVIYGEHVMDITNEAWGRILYQFKRVFSKNERLKTKMLTCRDHAHFKRVK